MQIDKSGRCTVNIGKAAIWAKRKIRFKGGPYKMIEATICWKVWTVNKVVGSRFRKGINKQLKWWRSGAGLGSGRAPPAPLPPWWGGSADRFERMFKAAKSVAFTSLLRGCAQPRNENILENPSRRVSLKQAQRKCVMNIQAGRPFTHVKGRPRAK